MRRICILVLGLFAPAVAALAIAGPAAAQTVPVSLSFNYAVLNTPGLPDQEVVSPATQPITATAQLDPSTGAFTVAPADFSFPTYSFTKPVPGTLAVSLNGPASGAFNPTTGALTMTADFLATINIPGLGSCTADAGTQTYSTSNLTPYPGVAFPKTATGPVTGPGAIAGDWPTVTSNGPACAIIAAELNGPGGFWISKDVPPPAPKLSISAAPKHATLATVGKSKTIKVTVRNTGNLGATNVSVCATAPKKVHVNGSGCKLIATLAAGAKKVVKFTLKGKHTGTFTVKFAATETGVKTAHTKIKLKVK